MMSPWEHSPCDGHSGRPSDAAPTRPTRRPRLLRAKIHRNPRPARSQPRVSIRSLSLQLSSLDSSSRPASRTMTSQAAWVCSPRSSTSSWPSSPTTVSSTCASPVTSPPRPPLTNPALAGRYRQNELREGAQRSVAKQYYYIDYQHFCNVVKWRVAKMYNIIRSSLRNVRPRPSHRPPLLETPLSFYRIWTTRATSVPNATNRIPHWTSSSSWTPYAARSSATSAAPNSSTTSTWRASWAARIACSDSTSRCCPSPRVCRRASPCSYPRACNPSDAARHPSSLDLGAVVDSTSRSG